LGINSSLTTIGRQASYAAYLELGAENADLGCAPALYAEVEEDVEFILQDNVIAIESCQAQCANHLVAEKGGAVSATVRVDEVLATAGIVAEDCLLEHVPLDHPAVIAVKNEIVRVAERLVSQEQED
jgi:hypothetical protein